jgi:hypothetical protein
MTAVAIVGALVCVGIGVGVGLLLAGMCAGAKEEDAYRAGYYKGLEEGNPFGVLARKMRRVGRELAEIERSYGGTE